MSNISLKRNVIISIFVQIVSIMVSFILNLIVPKFIPELQYSYWQTYMLYVGYVGILHFGLLDGLVLRYSQFDYDQLDKSRFRSQFQILLTINSILSLTSILVSIFFFGGSYKQIFVFVAFGIVTKNVFTYTSYSFQITNRISKYAIMIISQKLFYGVFTVLLLLFRVKLFYLYCIADLCGDVFGITVGFFFNKELYFGKTIPFRDALKEFKTNISSGILLLIANWSSMLLIGSAKMIVQWHWDELTFGKVSFAFSVSSLFLTFVTAISVVLFPALKRMDKDRLPQMYLSIRNTISPILFFAMLFYFPGYALLDKWLPKYHNSVVYLGILLPIIIYTSKVSLLTNNYLKAYREEKKMFLINVIFVLIAFIVFGVSAYIIDNLTILLIAIVIVIMLRSIVSEILVMKIISIKMYNDFIIEAIMTILFIMCAKYLSLLTGFIVYSALMLLYSFLYRKSIKNCISKLGIRR